MKKLSLLSLLFVFFFLAGCASTKVDLEAEKYFSEGNYSASASVIQKSINKKNPPIDKALDVAILNHYSKNYLQSSKDFNKTDRQMEDAYTKSISKSTGAASLNENISDYTGNVYEYLLINAFNSLNYYNMGEFDEALVEIRKIENKQKEYISKYGELALQDLDVDTDTLTESAKTMNVNMREVYRQTPRKPTEDDIYKDSAFAHYLAALMYIKDKSGTPELHVREYEAINRGIKCASLRDDLKIPSGMGRLDFVSLAGKIIRRKEGTVYFPSFAANGTPIFLTSVTIGDITIPAFRLKYVYPYVEADKNGNLVKPSDSISSIKVTLSDGSNARLNLIEWFDEAVQKDVALRARKDFIRSIFRSTTKKAAAVTSAAVAIRATPEKFRSITEIAVTKALDAVDLAETADIRQCRYFPSFAAGGGFTLKPGVYSAKVEYFDTNENLVGTETFENLEVTAGRPTIVESICIK